MTLDEIRCMELEEHELTSQHSKNIYSRMFKNNSNVVSLDRKRQEKEFISETAIKAESEEYKIETSAASKINYTHANYAPRLEDITSFYRSNGLVGDVETSILMTLGSIHKLCFGIESFSGSGKTVSLDILLKLFNPDDYYTLKLSSDKAVMYDSEQINKAKIFVITELQKSAAKTMIDILKDLGEGKSAERKVTNQNKTGVISQELDCDKAVIYTLALENWFKKDKELERRYFTLATDISQNQTKKILESIALREFKKSDEENNFTGLKQHIRTCLYLPEKTYCNPFASALIENIPATIKARSFINHYFSLMQACAKFNHPNRIQKISTIFLNLEDAYVIHELYGSQFEKSLLGVPFYGDKILELFDGKNQLSFSEINSELNEKGINLNKNFLSDSLNSMADSGFLEKLSGKNHFDGAYSRVESAHNFSKHVDWIKVWSSASDLMQEKHPDIYAAWRDANLKDNALYVFDLLKKEDRILFELK